MTVLGNIEYIEKRRKMRKSLAKKIPYVEIPNHFIRYKKTINLSALDMQMRLFLFVYCSKSFGSFWSYTTTLEHLLRQSGLTTERGRLKKTKYYPVLISTLNWFIENNYIRIIPNQDLETIPLNSIIEIHQVAPNGKFFTNRNFTKLTMSEYQILIENNSHRNCLTDLFIYVYIKSLMHNRRHDERRYDAPNCCIISQEQIATFCKLSLGTVIKIIDHLKSFDLIACEKPQNIRRKATLEDNPQILKHLDKYINTRTVYVLKTNGYEEELKSGVNKYIKDIIDNYQIKKSA